MTKKAYTFIGDTGAILTGGNQESIADVVQPSDLIPMTIARVAADGTLGTVKSTTKNVGSGGAPPTIISVTRTGAGRYTVVLSAGLTAANIGCTAGSNTSGNYAVGLITDATHIAVETNTDAGVATDGAFTLTLSNLAA